MDEIEEEKLKLEKYLAQKVQVELLHKQHPNNKDLIKLKEDLTELISMSKNFLEIKEKEAKEAKFATITQSKLLLSTPNYQPPPPPEEDDEEEEDEFERDLDKLISSKRKENEDGDDDEEDNKMKFEKGMSCRALWSGDGQWYDAIVETVHPERGTYTVVFVGYGNTDEVSSSCILSLNETTVEATSNNNINFEYQPNNKIGREFPNPNNVNLKPIPIPEALRIKPDDPKEVVIAKKKKLRAIKSQNRFQQMEVETKSKQNSWKQFVSGTTRKKGTFTSINKRSMFSTPESVTGKVGVIGSGQGMTSNREKKVEHKKTKITLPPSDEELNRLGILPAMFVF